MPYTLTRAPVPPPACPILPAHLQLVDYGETCAVTTLLAVVLAACSCLTSLFAAALRWRRAPSGETVRQALLSNLGDADERQRRCNHAWVADWPRALRRRRQRWAADLTLVPYHGQPWDSPLAIYRSKAKEGTSHFHAYATLSLVAHGQRFTLALTWVQRGAALEAVLQRWLRRAAPVGVRPRLLLLDRGFYSGNVIRSLQAARSPFLMPVVGRGRKADHPLGISGSRVFQYYRRSGWGEYPLTNAAGRRATVSIGGACRNRAGERRRGGREALVDASWGGTPASFAWVRPTYRQRFGIETSDRQLREGKVQTCTRNPAVRLFLVAVALLLRNVWVWLHGEHLSTPRRGGRRLRPERLRFKGMLPWLLEVAQEWLGTNGETCTDRLIGPEVRF